MESIELKSAEELKVIVDTAEFDNLLNCAKIVINKAAENGQHSLIWNHEMPENLKKELESKGFEVKPYTLSSDPTAIVPNQFVISGF